MKERYLIVRDAKPSWVRKHPEAYPDWRPMFAIIRRQDRWTVFKSQNEQYIQQAKVLLEEKAAEAIQRSKPTYEGDTPDEWVVFAAVRNGEPRFGVMPDPNTMPADMHPLFDYEIVDRPAQKGNPTDV